MSIMGERTRSSAADGAVGQRATAASSRNAAPAPGSLVARATALQRAVGNRAATRVLSRWAAHPDKDKKGVLMTDAMAGEYNRFNPPLSK
jgi:hypothetical protein